MALSTLLHSLLLVAFVLLWAPGERSAQSDKIRTVDLVLADVSGQDKTQYLDSLSALPQPEPAAADFLEALPLTEPAPGAVANDSIPLNSNTPNLNQLDAGAMTRPTGQTGLAVGGGGQFTADELKQIAAERQQLESMLPRGSPATVRVFGSGGLVGRKFIFLIDRSKSMGSEGLGVLDRANNELQKALAGLTADHQFQIIAYHHETAMIDRRALLEGTAENRQKIAEFLQNLAAFGGTEHESALIAALSFKPDIIVLMTDGGLPEMTEAQMATIRRMAGTKTQIHCLQFGVGPPPQQTFMQTLAEENGGSYKYIDVNQWN